MNANKTYLHTLPKLYFFIAVLEALLKQRCRICLIIVIFLIEKDAKYSNRSSPKSQSHQSYVLIHHAYIIIIQLNLEL